jgi:hypothetical protein
MVIRLFFIFILFSFISYADSCYSVALWSVPKDSNKIVNSIENDKNCRIFEISSQITQRCGCYSDIADAKKLLKQYIGKFHTAYVTLTLESRFEQVSKTLSKVKQDNITKEAVSETLSKPAQLPKTSKVEQENIIKTKIVNEASDMTFNILTVVIPILIILIVLIWRRPKRKKKKYKHSEALKSILID